MKIRVVIALSNMLFSEGICRLLSGEKDITVAEVLDPGTEYSCTELLAMKPTAVVTDFTTLYNSFPDLDRSPRKINIVLLDTNCGKENIVSAILNKKVSGVLLGNSATAHLLKAIRAVASGDVWIDKTTIKNLLHGINALGTDKTSILTGREKEIAALIGQGLRNKEIAQRLHISEPTVKTHLHRIFQKLNINTRSELITFAIKNNHLQTSLFQQASPES